MERERNEVYERIPWEMLERKTVDRQWVLFAVAGAVVLGALAYSFMTNRQPGVQAEEAIPTSPVTVEAVPEPAPVAAAPVAPVAPVVVSEADLYAVDTERMLDAAVAHAEWFVAEYFTVDGSKETAQALAGLLPSGLGVAETPPDIRVYVEWVKAVAVEEIDPFRYRVEVLVRYLKSSGDGVYQRQSPLIATVEIVSDDTGPHVSLPPMISVATPDQPLELSLSEVPEEVVGAVSAKIEGASVLGGILTASGSWEVVIVAPAPDGVIRPQTIVVP